MCTRCSPRIVALLRAQGQGVGAERLRRSVQLQGLRPVYKRPYRMTTDSAHILPVAPNVLDRRFDGWHQNQVWVSDITFLATVEGRLYPAAILDLASRRIVGWSMSERLQSDLVCQALRSASWQRKPATGLIFHSDQFARYCSHEYRASVAQFGMQANAPIESFRGTLKNGLIRHRRYITREQPRREIVKCSGMFYNRQRQQARHGYPSPQHSYSDTSKRMLLDTVLAYTNSNWP
jgi:putative transposase